MKKILGLVLLIGIGFSSTLKAQDGETGRIPFSFGPVVGMNYSRMGTKSIDENVINLKNSSRIGLRVGMYSRMHYHKLYFQPEIIFSWKGGSSKYDLVSPANAVDQHIKITTMDIPLLFGYNFGENLLNFRIFVGPVISYTMSEKILVTTSGAELLPEQKFNTKDATWSVTGGIGFDVWKFTIDLRYERALNDVSWNPSFKQHPGCFILSAGWKTF